MHETSIATSLVRQIARLASQQHGARVVGAKIRIGALAAISPEHLRYHFKEAAHGTVVEQVALTIVTGTETIGPLAQEVVLEDLYVEDVLPGEGPNAAPGQERQA